jgi:hypothetical protein
MEPTFLLNVIIWHDKFFMLKFLSELGTVGLGLGLENNN